MVLSINNAKLDWVLTWIDLSPLVAKSNGKPFSQMRFPSQLLFSQLTVTVGSELERPIRVDVKDFTEKWKEE